MSNSKKTKIISFVTTKGGAGKSTLSLALCTQINYYRPNINIIYYDMDFGTQSSIQQRNDDIEYLNQCLEQYPDIKLSKIYNELKLANSIYPIKLLQGNDIVNTFNKLPKDYYDLIYLDTPGSFDSNEWIMAMPTLDYLFIPCNSDLFSIRAAMKSYNTIYQLRKNNKLPKLKYYAILLSNIEHHHKIDDIVEEIDSLNRTPFDVQILKTIIPHKKELNEKKCISVVPIAQEYKNHYLKELYNEINEIIKLEE